MKNYYLNGSVKELEWDEKTGAILVTPEEGEVHGYHPVPKEIANKMYAYKSADLFLSRLIKNSFSRLTKMK